MKLFSHVPVLAAEHGHLESFIWDLGEFFFSQEVPFQLTRNLIWETKLFLKYNFFIVVVFVGFCFFVVDSIFFFLGGCIYF